MALRSFILLNIFTFNLPDPDNNGFFGLCSGVFIDDVSGDVSPCGKCENGRLVEAAAAGGGAAVDCVV